MEGQMMLLNREGDKLKETPINLPFTVKNIEKFVMSLNIAGAGAFKLTDQKAKANGGDDHVIFSLQTTMSFLRCYLVEMKYL
jgi:hypothetical protein